jgi:hypothetical protein
VKKHDLLNQIARDLGDWRHAPVAPLNTHEAYSFSAHVSADGAFSPHAPLASLPCRMFRVYGPHRFLRVHYEESLPKHTRLGTRGEIGACLFVMTRSWQV